MVVFVFLFTVETKNKNGLPQAEYEQKSRKPISPALCNHGVNTMFLTGGN
jgi:hypothetical protein